MYNDEDNENEEDEESLISQGGLDYGSEDLEDLEANDYDRAYPDERKEMISGDEDVEENNEEERVVAVSKPMFITINQLKQRTHQLIIDYFKENPNPTDEMIHEFAEELGMSHDQLENLIYKCMTKLIMNKPGKHDDVPDSEFDPEQLEMGIEVEKEHTDCPKVAASIARDHLVEIPDYYTRLLKMEKEAGVEED